MSLKFLAFLANAHFPYHTTFKDEIAHIETLTAAKLVFAEVPAKLGGQYVGEAVVDGLRQAGEQIVTAMLAADIPVSDDEPLVSLQNATEETSPVRSGRVLSNLVELMGRTVQQVLDAEASHLYAVLLNKITQYQLGHGSGPTNDDVELWRTAQAKRLAQAGDISAVD